MASSAWVVILDSGFNPFILGGGENFKHPEKIRAFYRAIPPKPAVIPAPAKPRKKPEKTAVKPLPVKTPPKPAVLQKPAAVPFLAPPPPPEPALFVRLNRKMQQQVEEMPLPEREKNKKNL